jgi:hypothetical protein
MATNDVDLFLTAHRQKDAGVDREEREADHPSDHSPAWQKSHRQEGAQDDVRATGSEGVGQENDEGRKSDGGGSHSGARFIPHQIKRMWRPSK